MGFFFLCWLKVAGDELEQSKVDRDRDDLDQAPLFGDPRAAANGRERAREEVQSDERVQEHEANVGQKERANKRLEKTTQPVNIKTPKHHS